MPIGSLSASCLAPTLAIALAAGGCGVGIAGEPDRGDRPLRDALLLKATMIAGHAAARAAAGVPPLAWDATLVASAQAYADAMAHTGLFRHAVQPAGDAAQGENLWTGTRGAYRYAEMLDFWTAERSDFVNGPTPAFSRSGDWHRVGHYTQIVWRGTTRFGCAMASDTSDDYLVCRYASPGNVMGQRAL